MKSRKNNTEEKDLTQRIQRPERRGRRKDSRGENRDQGQTPQLIADVPYGYTFGMKTAISIPDEVFEDAERLARRTKRSRSRLFSDALKEYLARHTPDRVTEAMNKALEEVGEASDPFVSAGARRVLERSEW